MRAVPKLDPLSKFHLSGSQAVGISNGKFPYWDLVERTYCLVAVFVQAHVRGAKGPAYQMAEDLTVGLSGSTQVRKRLCYLLGLEYTTSQAFSMDSP